MSMVILISLKNCLKLNSFFQNLSFVPTLTLLCYNLTVKSIRELFSDNKDSVKELTEKHKYVTREFQDYGYRIAHKLGDLTHVSMYIKLAKNKPRVLLEQAFSFAIDYPNAKNRGRLFMWKLKQLEDENKPK